MCMCIGILKPQQQILGAEICVTHNYNNEPEKVSVPKGTTLHTEASVDSVPDPLHSGHLGHVIL